MTVSFLTPSFLNAVSSGRAAMMTAVSSGPPAWLGSANTPEAVIEVYQRYPNIWKDERLFERNDAADLVRKMQLQSSGDVGVFIDAIQDPNHSFQHQYAVYRGWFQAHSMAKVPSHLQNDAVPKFFRYFIKDILARLRKRHFGRPDLPSRSEVPLWNTWPSDRRSLVLDFLKRWDGFPEEPQLGNPHVYFLARTIYPEAFREEPVSWTPCRGAMPSHYIRPPEVREIRAVRRRVTLPQPVSRYPEYEASEPTIYFWRLQKELRLNDLQDTPFLSNLMAKLKIGPLEGRLHNPLEATLIDVPEDHSAVSALVEGWVKMCVQKDPQTPPDFPNRLCARLVFRENPGRDTYRTMAIRDYFYGEEGQRDSF
ncbi:MAG TPA: hypothetical protein VLJ37_12035 [bacterium]|nr:hypothetical protein [bacterium]